MSNGRAGFAGIDCERVLRNLRRRSVNYSSEEVDDRNWNVDTHRTALPPERPGPPEAAGSWVTAAGLIRDYEFSAPQVVRAVYDPAEPLLNRTMLLEGRFAALRLHLGVRITDVIDETRSQGQRAWGWSYDTLHGHLERGRLTYEVVKHQDSGHVEFVISACSQPAPTLGPVLRLGWAVFGRRRQLLFYRSCGRRMHQFVRARRGQQRPPRTGGLVLAPSDARPHPLDRLALHRTDPG